jgi:hypothetical protein
VLLTAGAGIWATGPAQAGIDDPCDSSYHPVARGYLVDSAGTRVGRLVLSARSGTKEFCGRAHVNRSHATAETTVRLKLGVVSPSGASGGAGHSQFPAAHVQPIGIDAHGYPAGSTVRFVAIVHGAERIKATLTATVTSP